MPDTPARLDGECRDLESAVKRQREAVDDPHKAHRTAQLTATLQGWKAGEAAGG
jgi:hypothetical protein